MPFTTINKSSLHFNTKLYTGNGSAGRDITGIGFQPDWVWIKNRSRSSNHTLVDVLRGSGSYPLSSSSTVAQDTGDTNQVSALISDGFTVGSSTNTNANSENLVGWSWKANGAGSANTDGSINTTYTSANTTSGFSIIQYTGNATAGATIGHGLGKVPEFIIFRRYAQAENWGVYLKAAEGATDFKRIFYLNTNGGGNVDTTVLNNTEPSSSLITLGTSVLSNASNPMIAYAFAPIQGFSKFGKYIGSGNADGPVVYTGFKPALIIFKKNATDNWWMFDNKRDPDNVTTHVLMPDENAAETSGSSEKYFDILSNGFKIRNTTTNVNGAGTDYYYMAFAEAPLVGSNNVPATAR